MMTPREYYQSAAKQGLKEYSQKTSIGQIGYLTSLEGLLKDTEIVSQINLGIFEIPLKKNKGNIHSFKKFEFCRKLHACCFQFRIQRQMGTLM